MMLVIIFEQNLLFYHSSCKNFFINIRFFIVSTYSSMIEAQDFYVWCCITVAISNCCAKALCIGTAFKFSVVIEKTTQLNGFPTA